MRESSGVKIRKFPLYLIVGFLVFGVAVGDPHKRRPGGIYLVWLSGLDGVLSNLGDQDLFGALDALGPFGRRAE